MSEILYTGLQVIGCMAICFAAGVGVGFFGRGIIEALSMPDCEKGDRVGL